MTKEGREGEGKEGRTEERENGKEGRKEGWITRTNGPPSKMVV